MPAEPLRTAGRLRTAGALLVAGAPGAARRIGAVARHQGVLLRRSPGQVVVYTVMAILLTAVVEPMVGRLPAPGVTAPAGARAAAAMLVFCSLFMAGVVGSSLVDERAWRTADRLRSTPVRPAEVLAGKALPLLVLLLLQQAAVIGTASLLFPTGMPARAPQLAATGVGWAVCVLGIGVLQAALVRTPAQLSTAKDLTALALSTAGGAVVPIAALPGWLAQLSRLSPSYWAVEGFVGGAEPAWLTAGLPAAIGTACFALAAVGQALATRPSSALLERCTPFGTTRTV
jgi:ABC-2 type transport system permease protein